ncbi:hypothetical protein D3C73_1120690 [compost metagenome]
MNGIMAKKEISNAVRYTHQCCSLGSPAFSTSASGKATKLDINIACNTKIPRSSRSRSGCLSVGINAWRATPDSRCCNVPVERGTMNMTITMPSSAMPPVARNNPDRPKARVSNGPTTMATANDRPMVMPIMAMALVRCCSRVRSDNKAMTAAEIAPAPCRIRPAITPQIESALAASTLPRANTIRPR